MILDLQSALDSLKLRCSPTVYPTLSDSELIQILQECQRARIWTASTPYAVGDVVIPATRNGHRFRALVAGTSGATEPTWGSVMFSSATDNDITWAEDGIELDVYDIRHAAYLAWMLKFDKASANVDFESQSRSHKASQIPQRCLERARTFAPIDIA